MGIFKRNLTSEILEREAIDILANQERSINVLEIGCGDGNISLNLVKEFPQNSYHASDISLESILVAKDADPLKRINFQVSNGLDVWLGNRFDLIICDIASINQDIAELSDWYDGISCETGIDGLDLVIPIIQKIKQTLSVSGYLIMPIISLSNISKHKEALHEVFDEVTYSKEIEWPLPKTLVKAMIEDCISFNSESISTKNKFDLIIASTRSAICR